MGLESKRRDEQKRTPCERGISGVGQIIYADGWGEGDGESTEATTGLLPQKGFCVGKLFLFLALLLAPNIGED